MMTVASSKNYSDQVLSDAYQEGHGVGFKAARKRFAHPIYPLELAILGASFGIGSGLIWLIGPFFT